MARSWIEYVDNWYQAPMAPWVHRRVEGGYDPPAPAREPRGYPLYCVRTCGFVFQFSSRAQLEHAIEVLGSKLMPTTLELSRRMGPGWGPNQHWLSRLPGDLKGWKTRRRVVIDLETRRARWWSPQNRPARVGGRCSGPRG